VNITRTAAGTLLAAASVIALGACGTTVSKTPAALPTIFTPSPATSAPAPATSPADVTAGSLGTSFTVTTTDDNGNAVVYTVTLVKVDQHASLAQYETVASAGDHMAAVRFTISGVTGQVSDDANSDAAATGSDTEEYPFSASNVTDGPNFSYGTFHAGPGQTVSGWVSFEVPAGVTLASVAWQPSLEGEAATWVLGS
jgi:hypothetical protein